MAVKCPNSKCALMTLTAFCESSFCEMRMQRVRVVPGLRLRRSRGSDTRRVVTVRLLSAARDSHGYINLHQAPRPLLYLCNMLIARVFVKLPSYLLTTIVAYYIELF